MVFFRVKLAAGLHLSGDVIVTRLEWGMNTPLQISMKLGAVQAQSVRLLKEKEPCLNRNVLREAAAWQDHASAFGVVIELGT